MPSVKRRGDSFRIMVSLGYGMDGRQIVTRHFIVDAKSILFSQLHPY